MFTYRGAFALGVPKLHMMRSFLVLVSMLLQALCLHEPGAPESCDVQSDADDHVSCALDASMRYASLPLSLLQTNFEVSKTRDVSNINKAMTIGHDESPTISFDNDAVALVKEMQGLDFKERHESKHSFEQCLNQYADGLHSVDSRWGSSVRARPRTASRTSERKVVFGAGLAHTATRSLTQALLKLDVLTAHNSLGTPSHCQWLCNDWIASPIGCGEKPVSHLNASACHAAYRDYDYTKYPHDLDAAVDTPIPSIFLDLVLSYPNARWILTTRPIDDWVEAMQSRMPPFAFLPIQWPCGQEILKGTTSEKLRRLGDLHNDLVRCVVPPQNLFEINVWNSTDGLMNNLAEFLEIDHPARNMPFPRDLDKDYAESKGLERCFRPCGRFGKECDESVNF